MTDEPQEHRESNRIGWGCAVAVLLLLLFYLLSPPFVVLIFGIDTLAKFPWYWGPIFWLEKNSDLYLSYLELFPAGIWK